MTADNPEPKDGVEENWIICTENEKDKASLMNGIIKLRLKLQHDLGFYFELNNKKTDKKPTKTDTLGDYTAPGEEIHNSVQNIIDGHWVLLKDWGECNLKCGGGKMFQQLMCVPPKANGKPCLGPAIRTRPCNTDPCPEPPITTKMDLNPVANSPNGSQPSKMLKAEFKIMPISQRPARYDKCYLKETDMLMVKQDRSTKDFSTLPKIPVRVVMNNKSFAAFQDDTLTTNLATFVLSRTNLLTIPNEDSCFLLSSASTKAQFCKIDNSGSDFVEEWKYDFNLFKRQCKEKRPTIEVSINEEQKLEEEYKKKMNEVKGELVQEREDLTKAKVEEKAKKELQTQVDKTEEMGLMAVEKEVKLEEMIEHEEQDKERRETQELELEVQSEKKKDECLLKAIAEKEKENQYNTSKLRVMEKIQNIKEEIKGQVQMKRNQIKRKILMMRKKNSRQKEALNEEITLIRTKMTEKIGKLAANGDEGNCFNPKFKTETQVYCVKNFAADYANLIKCQDVENFCYICCEHEFGELNIQKRDRCYDKCDGKATSTAKSDKDNNNGKWLWVNN